MTVAVLRITVEDEGRCGGEATFAEVLGGGRFHGVHHDAGVLRAERGLFCDELRSLVPLFSMLYMSCIKRFSIVLTKGFFWVSVLLCGLRLGTWIQIIILILVLYLLRYSAKSMNQLSLRRS